MAKMPYQPSENMPIRDIAYETLKHAIIVGEIPAGSRIVETSYAEKMHISRTPLREALRKLERDGLVEYLHHKGVIVRAFTLEDIEEIFTIRNAMMMLILPSIVENVNSETLDTLKQIVAEMDVAQEKADAEALATLNRAFHGTIEHLSNKKRILNVIDSQEEYIIRFSAMTIASIVRRSNAHQEHHEILKLLEERNLDELMMLMHKHLEESKETCLAAVSRRNIK